MSTLEIQPVETIIRVMLTPTRALDEYLADLERRRYSTRTINTYADLLGKLCDSLPHDLDVSKVTLDTHIRPFLSRWRNSSPGTKAHAEAVVNGFFKWLYIAEKITRNPVDRLNRTRRTPSEDLDVVTVSPDDVRLMLMKAETWAELLAINVLVYLGPRRHAAAQLKITDYNRDRGCFRFQEKGGKTIYKPLPDELDMVIEQAIAAGVYDDQPYIIPSEGPLSKRGERDDRCIWRLVKRVAHRAGVDAHVHALRAAFACYYLEQNVGDMEGLKELMGHRSIKTTQIYLRKLDKQAAMERVRTLSWGRSPVGQQEGSPKPANSEKTVGIIAFSGGGRIRTSVAGVPASHAGWNPTLGRRHE